LPAFELRRDRTLKAFDKPAPDQWVKRRDQDNPLKTPTVDIEVEKTGAGRAV
jgi:hypothetical protein